MNSPDETTELRLHCNKDLALKIQAALKETSTSKCLLTERKNIHGDASSCVLIATLVIRELPRIIAKLKDLAAAAPIRRLQFGDVKVENVSSAELAQILASKGNSKRKRSAKNPG